MVCALVLSMGKTGKNLKLTCDKRKKILIRWEMKNISLKNMNINQYFLFVLLDIGNKLET